MNVSKASRPRGDYAVGRIANADLSSIIPVRLRV
jgi:hypothetical protein